MLVSVFVFDLVANADKAALGRNAFKRSKTLRHPSILPYLDGLEVSVCALGTAPARLLARGSRRAVPGKGAW